MRRLCYRLDAFSTLQMTLGFTGILNWTSQNEENKAFQTWGIKLQNQ